MITSLQSITYRSRSGIWTWGLLYFKEFTLCCRWHWRVSCKWSRL